MHKWTIDDIPDQHGRTAVVTGANSGIGYETALALAGQGAQVVLAVRSLDKGQQAARSIRQRHSNAQIEIAELDLSSLESIRRFAAAFLARRQPLALLINNAGVMAIPYRQTVDGFEMQFGTNHLGHFALTGLLLPALLTAPRARIVTVSSINHHFGAIAFDNLDASQRYGRFGAYNQSKLANLLFAYELQRRLEAVHAEAISVACHPGYSATNLQTAGPRMSGARLREITFRLVNTLVAQKAAMGALPVLYAATAPGVNGCDYIGPRGIGGLRGHPGKIRSSRRSYDPVAARELWQVSEQLTGVHYDFEGTARERAN